MQRELFKDLTAEEQKIIEPISVNETQPSFFEKMRIVITLDKIILWMLINITTIVFVYSFGVERGVKSTKNQALSIKEEPTIVTEAKTESPAELSSAAKAVESRKVQEEEKSQDNGVEKIEKFFTIQLVTYRQEKKAKQEIERLAQKGHKAFVIPSGKFYQVCVDTFAQKREALQKLVELKADGFQKMYQGAYVRPIKR